MQPVARGAVSARLDEPRLVDPLRIVWDDKRQAWGLAVLAPSGFAVLAGWWTPRGPMSAFEGLTAMGLGLLVGLAAGLLLRSRWAMLVAPVAFVVVLELARLQVSGPTVDGVHLGSTYGILAFAVGRGVHGLLALVPMVLGAAVGAALARRRQPNTGGRRGFLHRSGVWLRRAVAVTTGLVLVALAGFVARPAGTDPIVDAAGPPYTRMLDYEPALSHEQELYPYSRTGNSEGPGQMGENIFVREHTLLEQLHIFGGFLDTFSALYPRIQDVDLRTQATRLEVPVYLAQGAHEAPGRAEPAREWFEMLQAPSKRLLTFDTSGHRPLWEQPEPFHDRMTRVLAETEATAR